MRLLEYSPVVIVGFSSRVAQQALVLLRALWLFSVPLKSQLPSHPTLWNRFHFPGGPTISERLRHTQQLHKWAGRWLSPYSAAEFRSLTPTDRMSTEARRLQTQCRTQSGRWGDAGAPRETLTQHITYKAMGKTLLKSTFACAVHAHTQCVYNT